MMGGEASGRTGSTAGTGEQRFEIRSTLELGDTTFVIARQLGTGSFLVASGALLGGVPIEPEVDEPRTSTTHEVVNAGIYIFTLTHQADARHLHPGQVVHLTEA